MIIFVESPWPILLIGIAVEAVLAIFLLRTGQGRLLFAMLGVGLLVVVGLLVEHFVVTDRKAIINTLDAAAAAVESNNLNRLLDCISPSADPIRSQSRRALDRFEFRLARIHDLQIVINHLTSPPTAQVTLRAVGSGRDRTGEIPYQGFAETVTVTLRQEHGRWLVADYRDEERRLP